MLAERVIEWTQQWKEEGLREGIQQGIQQGQAEERRRTLAAERALLLRLVRKRFGEGYTQALPPVLEARQDTESLAEIGEWIVTCQTGEEFLTKVQERFPSSCER